MRIETERLILRRPEARDAQAYTVIRNSEFVLRYNAMEPKSETWVRAQFSDPAKNENTVLLERKIDGAVVGAVFLEADDLRWGVESRTLSYFLGERFARRGYMKEAMCAVIGYLFKTEKLDCLCARSFAPNTASRRLLESLGFHHDGTIRRCVKGYGDVIYDDAVYSLLREDKHP